MTKPFDVEELRLRVEHAFEKVQLSREVERLKEEVGRKYGIEHVIGKAKQIIDVFIRLSADPNGKKMFRELYQIDGFVTATDQDYDSVRAAFSAAGIQLKSALRKAPS